jgi:hypothetical protein
MLAWEYGQLTVSTDATAGEHAQMISWQGPGSELKDFPKSEQTVLELINELGANGWELTSTEDDKRGGRRETDWGSTWSLVRYTFKRPVRHAVGFGVSAGSAAASAIEPPQS